LNPVPPNDGPDLAGPVHPYWSQAELQTNAVILLHLAGALLLGLLVGYERSYHGRAAGMRTYGLVCMASCALTIIAGYPNAWYGGHGARSALVDPTRVIQGVVTGIGFLGAGVIMRSGFNISGLTTAASIWASSVIGIMVGVGFYMAAMGLAFFSAMIMIYLNRVVSLLPSRQAVAVTLRFKPGVRPQEDELRKRRSNAATRSPAAR
jgi:putative Mg2+ transporter-C (MgtC) family protein